MKRPHASDDVRERALAAVDAGQSIVDVATFYQNDPSTIRRWVRQRRRTGSGLTRPRSGRPRLIQAEQQPRLVDQLRQHPDWTLAQHCQQWQITYGIRLSLSTMSRQVRHLGWTLKKRP